MLSDRPYMRGDYPRPHTSVLTWLLCALASGFILQLIAAASWPGGRTLIEQQFGLTAPSLRDWHLWTLVTHAFLHDPHYFFHALGCFLLTYFAGREVLPVLGARRFLLLFLGANLIGGATWAALHWRTGGMHLGSMAAAHALLAVYACWHPDRRVDFLLLFIPISLKPKHVVWFLTGSALVGFIFFELRSGPQPFGKFTVASSAHLAGLLFGWVYFRFIQDASWPRLRWSRESTDQRARMEIPAAELDTPADSIETKAELRARVDRVLDKINSQGLASLTNEEKRLLDDAKDLLSRH